MGGGVHMQGGNPLKLRNLYLSCAEAKASRWHGEASPRLESLLAVSVVNVLESIYCEKNKRKEPCLDRVHIYTFILYGLPNIDSLCYLQ
jgi:hypothetical protein